MNYHELSANMQACIELCMQCYQTCINTASMHCLHKGGKHVEENHMRIMLSCAEICRTAAHVMLTGSPLHGIICGACAKLCVACAESCREVGEMEECAALCDQCSKRCEEMAKPYESAVDLQSSLERHLPTPA